MEIPLTSNIYFFLGGKNMQEKNIKNTLIDVRNKNFGYDIILIDNGSDDNTVKIANEMGVEVISHCINSGSSAGTLMTYFLYAYKNDYDILCQFDGDGQHIASELPKIIEPIQNDEADYVIGSRFLQKEGFQSYLFRRMGIKLFSYFDSRIIGTKITDVTSGFRAYNRKALEKINFELDSYAICTEILKEAKENNLKVEEIPIDAIYPKELTGTTVIAGFKILIDMLLRKVEG